MLSDEYKDVIDYYCAAAKHRSKKDTTIYNEASHASTFLYELQEQGFRTLQAVTEKAVLSIFIGDGGQLLRSYSYKKDVAAVFKACIPQNPETFEKLLSYLPVLRESRKNIQYLQPEEIAALKQVMADADSHLTLRNRAIGILILNTGLRCCDIAGMTLNSIDWDNDLILISQQKTEAPLVLPLSATVGNAIYDYLTLERPKSECEHIFVSEHRPHGRLKSASLTNISDKLLAVANIRQSVGDRRGFHIFRHRLATALLGNGVARPVISQILGHESPNSLETYLSADFVHLKECALSVESFSMDEGVFANA
jgi:integrase